MSEIMTPMYYEKYLLNRNLKSMSKPLLHELFLEYLCKCLLEEKVPQYSWHLGFSLPQKNIISVKKRSSNKGKTLKNNIEEEEESFSTICFHDIYNCLQTWISNQAQNDTFTEKQFSILMEDSKANIYSFYEHYFKKYLYTPIEKMTTNTVKLKAKIISRLLGSHPSFNLVNKKTPWNCLLENEIIFHLEKDANVNDLWKLIRRDSNWIENEDIKKVIEELSIKKLEKEYQELENTHQTLENAYSDFLDIETDIHLYRLNLRAGGGV